MASPERFLEQVPGCLRQWNHCSLNWLYPGLPHYAIAHANRHNKVGKQRSFGRLACMFHAPRIFSAIFLFSWLQATSSITIAAEQTAVEGYYRYPAIHGDTIAFTAEGDLWRVGLQGGVAERLTSHLGEETSAAFSPDGQWLAFSAQYEGPTEVYLMPSSSGLPKRLTFEGAYAKVVGWTPDGKILFTPVQHSTLPDWQLATVDPNNSAITLLPLSQANDGVFDPGGKTLYFTRLAFQGSSTKRYKGGTAQHL